MTRGIWAMVYAIDMYHNSYNAELSVSFSDIVLVKKIDSNYISIDVNQIQTSGTKIAEINDTPLYVPTVNITRQLQSGNQIATINGTQLYAPSISFSQNLTSGTKVGSLTINGVTTDLYAPSTSINRSLNSGIKIATINGTTLYAPTPPTIMSGTTEYEDGVTSLATGAIYLQYEE